jgi:hypothetical protein
MNVNNLTEQEIATLVKDAGDAIRSLVWYIEAKDPSYARNLEQQYRAYEVINNLERYALAIKERMS